MRNPGSFYRHFAFWKSSVHISELHTLSNQVASELIWNGSMDVFSHISRLFLYQLFSPLAFSVEDEGISSVFLLLL